MFSFVLLLFIIEIIKIIAQYLCFYIYSCIFYPFILVYYFALFNRRQNSSTLSIMQILWSSLRMCLHSWSDERRRWRWRTTMRSSETPHPFLLVSGSASPPTSLSRFVDRLVGLDDVDGSSRLNDDFGLLFRQGFVSPNGDSDGGHGSAPHYRNLQHQNHTCVKQNCGNGGILNWPVNNHLYRIKSWWP